MTPDRNFVVDTLASKGMPQIVVCCGAGHAYKYVQLFVFSVFLAQLTMSARAFLITQRPSSVRLSVCLLDYLSKPISSYSFNRIAFKLDKDITYEVTNWLF